MFKGKKHLFKNDFDVNFWKYDPFQTIQKFITFFFFFFSSKFFSFMFF